MKKPPVVLIGVGVVLVSAGIWVQGRFGGRVSTGGLGPLPGSADTPIAHAIASPATVSPATTVPTDHHDAKTATAIAGQHRLTDRMREQLTGLDGLFSEEELAFRHAGALERVAESLADFRSNAMLGIVKLQRALEGIEPSSLNKVYDLIRRQLPPEQVETIGAYRILFRAWGAVDGATALTLAATHLPKNPVRLEAGREAMQSWARQDPAAAARAVAALPNIYGKDYLVYALPATYMITDPAAAMAWAESLPPDLRSNTLLHCMITWLDTDPQAARDHATKLAGRPGAVDAGNGVIFSRTAGTLARKDIADAVDWVEHLPPESLARGQATLGLIDWWGMTDPEKAGAWLGRRPRSTALDPAIDRFARDLVHRDPAGAKAWAGAITDPVLRAQCINSLRSAELQPAS